MSEQRFEELQKLTREAAELLGLPENNARVVLLAALKLSHQVQVERMVAGANVEPNNLLGITEAISKLAPPTPPQTITIKIMPPTDAAPPDAAAVDGLLECRRCHWKPNGRDRVSQCYRCGWRHGMDMHAPWASPLNPEPKGSLT